MLSEAQRTIIFFPFDIQSIAFFFRSTTYTPHRIVMNKCKHFIAHKKWTKFTPQLFKLYENKMGFNNNNNNKKDKEKKEKKRQKKNVI